MCSLNQVVMVKQYTYCSTHEVHDDRSAHPCDRAAAADNTPPPNTFHLTHRALLPRRRGGRRSAARCRGRDGRRTPELPPFPGGVHHPERCEQQQQQQRAAATRRGGRVRFSPPIIVNLTPPPTPPSFFFAPSSPPSLRAYILVLPRLRPPPRKAGLGVFTGIDLLEGDGIAEPDLVVPFHEDYGIFDFDFLWRRYSWEPSELGMHFDMQDGLALVLGTGCVPNCDFALLNAMEGTVSPVRPLHRGWSRKKARKPALLFACSVGFGISISEREGEKTNNNRDILTSFHAPPSPPLPNHSARAHHIIIDALSRVTITRDSIAAATSARPGSRATTARR